MTIGKLASLCGVPTSTVRYYERRGLMPSLPRGKGSYRRYGREAVRRLRFIRSAQSAGFTLNDIATLCELQDAKQTPCKDVQKLIADRLARVEEQIHRLHEADRMLRSWLDVCCEVEPSGRCGVIEGLG